MLLRIISLTVLLAGTIAVSSGRRADTTGNGQMGHDTIADTLTDTTNMNGGDRGLYGDTLDGTGRGLGRDTLGGLDTSYHNDTANGMDGSGWDGMNGAGDTMTLQGTVLSVNSADSMIVLRSDSGMDTLWYSPAAEMMRGTKMSMLKEGQRVEVDYVTRDGRKTITHVEKAGNGGASNGRKNKSGRDTADGMIPGEMHEY